MNQGFMILLLRFKNSSIMLGVMYLIAFIFILPYMVSLRLPVGSTLLLLLTLVIAVAGVSLLLNWGYALIMALPTAMAILFFFAGWTLYILSPGVAFFMSLINSVLSIFDGAISVSANGLIQNMSTIGNHIGEFFISLGTAIWIHAIWLAKKTNYIAVGTFLAGMTLLGVAAGFTGLSGVAVFLIVWLIFYLKLKDKDTDEILPDLKRLFQIVATIVILEGTGMVSTVFTALRPALSAVDLLNNYSGYVGYRDTGGGLLSIWNWLWSIGLLVGTWKPKYLLKLIPSSKLGKLKDFIDYTLNN